MTRRQEDLIVGPLLDRGLINAAVDEQLPYACGNGRAFALVPPARSDPQLAVQSSILYGFRDVLGPDFFGAGEVGNRAGHLQYPVIRAGAEVEFRDSHLEQVLRLRSQFAVFL